MSTLTELFAQYNDHLEVESRKRDEINAAVKEIASKSRQILAALQGAQKSTSHSGIQTCNLLPPVPVLNIPNS
jgi:hypothetical protein